MVSPKSATFQVDKDSFTFIGLGKKQFLDFFKQLFKWCIDGKIYVLTVKELTASEAQRGYFFACFDVAANTIGHSSDELYELYKKYVFNLALNNNHPDFNSEDWIIDITDVKTGEVYQSLLPFNRWKTSQMWRFLEYFKVTFLESFQDTYPEFKFPNPDDWDKPVRGKKHQVQYPEARYVIKL